MVKPWYNHGKRMENGRFPMHFRFPCAPGTERPFVAPMALRRPFRALLEAFSRPFEGSRAMAPLVFLLPLVLAAPTDLQRALQRKPGSAYKADDQSSMSRRGLKKRRVSRSFFIDFSDFSSIFHRFSMISVSFFDGFHWSKAAEWAPAARGATHTALCGLEPGGLGGLHGDALGPPERGAAGDLRQGLAGR